MAGFCLVPFSLQAQTLPNAGSLLQPMEGNRSPALPKDARQPLPPPPPALRPSDPSQEVLVQSFSNQGNRLLSDAQLQPLLKPYVGKKLSYLGLQQVAARIAQAYSDAGWLARVYLPEQDVTDGHIVFQIVEALYGGARLQGAEPLRLKMSDVLARLDAQQPVGKPLNIRALDRALLLIQDLPGTSVSASLQEGKDSAETALILKMSDAPALIGEAGVDNTGSRSTGSNRVTLNANFYSPTGRGDLASVNLVHSEGSDYLRAAYSVPVGVDGWRVGVNALGLQYRVISPEFSALNASGNTSGVGLDASFPIVRARQSNLYLQLSANNAHAHNESLGAVQSDYQVESVDATLSGNVFDNLGGGGANAASLGLTSGSVISNSGDPTPNNHPTGKFDKLHVDLSRQQTLSETLSLYAAWTAQITSNQLESSEKFYLGGASGVRAFAVSEAGGSAGQMLNLELRYRLPSNVTLAGFWDWGEVNNYDRTASYSLHGRGLSLKWQTPWGPTLKASLARRGSANPNPTATGTDQDGSYIEDRFWLSLTEPF
jgi:hemolysin activation/secretion protein